MNLDTLATSPNLKPTPSPSLWKKVTSFPVLLGVLLAGGMFVPLRTFWVDPDVWWHIKVGATLLSTHHWPTVDPYSFTARGSPWMAYEWLGDLLLAAVQGAGGIRGLMLLDFVLAGAILFALYALTTLRCGNPKAAFVACVVTLPLVYLFCSLRPLMLGYLFLIFTLIILERFRRGRTGTLWLLPPLFLLWVNTHSSFILGLFVLGVYVACGLVNIHWGNVESRPWTSGERLRLELVTLLILIALTITPYGPDLFLYPLGVFSPKAVMLGSIQEWLPMNFAEVYGKLFLALVLGFVAAQVTLRPAWRLEELALFLAGVTAACVHVRFLLLFVPFAVPLFAVILAHGIPPYAPAKDRYALNAVLLALGVAGMVWLFPSRAKLDSLMEERWPVKAVAYLKLHPAPLPMYNNYGYGGYLIWQLDGQNKVFIDGRMGPYVENGSFKDYMTISQLGTAGPYLLDAYQIQSCLVDRTEPLATLLANSPKWKKVYSDKLAALFVRTVPPGLTPAR